MTKIIVVDDQTMFLESISKLLTLKKVAKVLAEAKNGKHFLTLLESHSPDLVLMDINMPEMDGIEATKQAIQKYPDLKVLALSSFGDEQYYFSMVEAGAKGFILKSATIAELETAIKEVISGGSWFSTDLLQKIILNIRSKPQKKETAGLSERELEILKLVCSNYSNEQIANKINLSYDTIKWHRANILSKTGCTNAVGLLIYALKNKIVEI